KSCDVTYTSDILHNVDLVELFCRQIDPTDDGGQFHDRGSSYKTAIFYQNDAQKTIAENSKQALIDSGKFKKPIVTPIVPAEPFYEAEEEHQYYYKRNHFH